MLNTLRQCSAEVSLFSLFPVLSALHASQVEVMVPLRPNVWPKGGIHVLTWLRWQSGEKTASFAFASALRVVDS